MDKKLTDAEILQMIAEFETLKEEDKAARLLGQGVDKLVYDIPGKDMVMKIPNHTREYGNTSLENDYIYSKQLNRHVPVETPILVKRPESSDVLLQKKMNMITDPESPTDEFYDSLRDKSKYPDSASVKSAMSAERKRVNALPGNVAYDNYLKSFDDAGLEDGDIHRGNVALDSDGKAKAMDVSKFWTNDRNKNDALHKMRETFSDKMDKLAKTRIFRGIAAGLPVVGTAAAVGAALQSPDASAAVGDALVPGGLESLGPSAEDAAIENPQQNQELRQEALKKMLGK